MLVSGVLFLREQIVLKKTHSERTLFIRKNRIKTTQQIQELKNYARLCSKSF